MNIKPWLIPNNIYSRSPEPFLQALTNPTLRATKLKRQYPVEYGGYKFADADSAFFGLREAFPEEMHLDLLADINAAKFMQHGKLGHELNKRATNGDIEGYFNTLVHRTGKNSPKWEGEGLQSRAIQALNTGYSRAAQGQLAMEAQVRDALTQGYSPMGSKSLAKYSSQLSRPLESMVTSLSISTPQIVVPRMADDIFAPSPKIPPQPPTPDLRQQYQDIQDNLIDLAYAAQSQYGLRDMASSMYP